MQKYVIALYIRLSIEDYKYDSLSIENQSLVLHEYNATSFLLYNIVKYFHLLSRGGSCQFFRFSKVVNG